MSAVLKLPEKCAPQPLRLTDDVRVLLNQLRFQATTCRASAFLDIFQACSVLDPVTEDANNTRQITLLRILGQALDHAPVFYRPGEKNLSFDEKWLAALIEASKRGDRDSFAFLLNRRVAQSKRRIIGSLIASLANT